MRLALMAMVSKAMRLGPVQVAESCLEHVDSTTFCASLRPVVDGHLVVAPLRQVVRVGELPDAEFDELFVAVRRAQARLLAADASIVAFNVAVKDGAAAGQPVPHAHVHVVPRRVGDMRSDYIYELLDSWTPAVMPSPVIRLDVPDEASRLPRSPEAMADEARLYGGEQAEGVLFGKIRIDPRQVFFVTPTVLALVNLKPLVDGHVLVIPRRVVPVLADLDEDESRDLWRAARAVANIVTAFHGKDAANFAVQDGKHAGQSVPHVHVHVLPR